MDYTALKIRPGEPIIQEGLLFGSYLRELAFFYRVLLGRRVVEIIGEVYIQTNHDLSHRNVLFADCDGSILGMISGFTAEQHRQSDNSLLRSAMGQSALRNMGMALLLTRQQRFLNTHRDGDFYIQGFIVEKDHRGQGIGSILIDSIEELARSSGSRRLMLVVDAKNEGARRFYARHGMKVENGWPNFLCMPQMILKMAKPL